MTVQACAAVISSYLPEPHASLLNGIIFGIPFKSAPVFYQQLKTVGLLHLVVLSGSNIAILGSITAACTRFLPKRLSLLACITVIVLFTLFVGPQPPIVRAAIMGVLGLTATLFGKKASALISLLVCVLIVAFIKEKWLESLSFQLSVGATLGIVIFASGARGIRGELRTSLAAQAFTAPLIFLAFREISLISPLSTLLVSFLVPPLMIFGFLTAVLGLVHHSLGVIPGLICFSLLQYMVITVRILSQIPFIYFRFSP